VGACSPTDFINGFTIIFFGVTCDHSLGGSQVFTKFPMNLFVKLMLLGVPDSANLPKFGRVSPWLFTTCKKQQGKWGKRCPKRYWRTLQNMLEMYKFIPSKKLQTMLTIDQESKLKHKLS
jgi:hypothetical protein